VNSRRSTLEAILPALAMAPPLPPGSIPIRERQGQPRLPQPSKLPHAQRCIR
jgi:hypothetical protein